MEQWNEKPELEAKVIKDFERYKKILGLTEEDFTKSILDVGAGKGEFIQYLRKIYNNTNAYALDNQEEKSNKEGWHIAGSGLEIPFPDDQFEVITAKHYVSMLLYPGRVEYKKAVEEFVRVVKKGGKIVFDAFTEESIKKEIDHLLKEPDQYTEDVVAQYNNALPNAIGLNFFLQQLKESGVIAEVNNKGEIYIITK